MPDIFLYQGEANPNDIVLSDPTVQRGGGSPVNYTLVCASGSYVYTGQAATLSLARKLSLAAGAYVYAGQAASLTVARKLALDAGAYAYVGQDATLTYVAGAVNYVLACDAGAYVYTGQAASLTVARRLPLDAGAYVYAGNAASLTVARRLSLDAGAYAYAGNDATLDYVPGKVNYTLACDAGVYTYAGNDAVLTYVSGLVVVPSSGGGGGGYKYPSTYWNRRKTGQDYSGAAINEILEKAASEVYAELARNKAVQEKAVAIIRPFTDSKAKKPQVASIDWYAIERDAQTVHALLQLWSDQVAGMQEEEDMFAILLLES